MGQAKTTNSRKEKLETVTLLKSTGNDLPLITGTSGEKIIWAIVVRNSKTSNIHATARDLIADKKER